VLFIFSKFIIFEFAVHIRISILSHPISVVDVRKECPCPWFIACLA
jgi:hypothetical protein